MYNIYKWRGRSVNFPARSCSHRIILCNASQKFGQNISLFDAVSKQELVHVTAGQITTGSTLASNFAFGSHPHIFDILSVDLFVVRVDEVALVNHNSVRIYTPSNPTHIGVCSPSVRNDVAAWQDVLTNFSIWDLHKETLPRPTFSSNTQWPCRQTPLWYFRWKNLDSSISTVIDWPFSSNPPNFLRVPLYVALGLLAKKVAPVNDCAPQICPLHGIWSFGACQWPNNT